MNLQPLFTFLITLLYLFLLLGCEDGNNVNRKESVKTETKEKPNVFYGVENINKEDTFTIYSPDIHEKFPTLKRKITFFFENDTLKFFTGLFGFYETIEINGFIFNNQMKYDMIFSECTQDIDSKINFTSEVRFSNKRIKPNDSYWVEFNIHGRLVDDYDSIEVFACGSYSGIIYPTVPDYIIQRREFLKENIDFH